MNSPQGLRFFLFVSPLRSTSSTQGSVARHGKRVEQIPVAGHEGLFFLSAPAFDLGFAIAGGGECGEFLLVDERQRLVVFCRPARFAG